MTLRLWRKVKVTFNQYIKTEKKKKMHSTSKSINLHIRKNILLSYIWSGCVTPTHSPNELLLKTNRGEDWEAFEMWRYRRRRKISWTDRVINERISIWRSPRKNIRRNKRIWWTRPQIRRFAKASFERNGTRKKTPKGWTQLHYVDKSWTERTHTNNLVMITITISGVTKSSVCPKHSP